MGVRGLHWILSNIIRRIDLVDKAAKQSTPLVLLADFFAFSFYIAEEFVANSNETAWLLDPRQLARFESMEVQKIRAIVWILLTVLKRSNIEIEFIADGAYKIGTLEGSTKAEEWKLRHNNRTMAIRLVEDGFASSSANTISDLYAKKIDSFPLPSLLSGTIAATIREMGLSMWRCDGEADQIIAEIQRKRSSALSASSNLSLVYGILSNDSDFALMKGSRLVLLSSLDVNKSLPKVVSSILSLNRKFISDPTFTRFLIDEVAHPSHKLTTWNAQVYTPADVAAHLRISESMLPEVSILAGNDFTKSFISKYPVFSPGKLENAAKMLLRSAANNRTSRVEHIRDFARVYWDSPELQEAVKFSRDFYGHETNGLSDSTTRRALEEYLKWRVGHATRGLNLENSLQRQDLCYLSNKNPEDRIDLLRKCCSLGIFPPWTIQAVSNKTIWLYPTLEPQLLPYGINDAVVDCRAHAYAVLGIPSSETIREYRRCGQESFYEVCTNPTEIPQKLTWYRVWERSAGKYQEPAKALIEIATRIIKCQNPEFVFRELPVPLGAVPLVFLNILGNLHFSSGPRVFHRHEIESIIIMSVVCLLNVPANANFEGINKEIYEAFRLPPDTVDRVVKSLIKQGFDKSEDPIGVLQRMYLNDPQPALKNLICSFRSLTVFSWTQFVWQQILDLASLYYGPVWPSRSTCCFALFINGEVFRWIYAAGARGQRNHVEALPKKVEKSAERRMELVAQIRSLFLATKEVQALLRQALPQ